MTNFTDNEGLTDLAPHEIGHYPQPMGGIAAGTAMYFLKPELARLEGKLDAARTAEKPFAAFRKDFGAKYADQISQRSLCFSTYMLHIDKMENLDLIGPYHAAALRLKAAFGAFGNGKKKSAKTLG